MIENFNNIYLLILFILLQVLFGVYLFRIIFAPEGLAKEFNVDKSGILPLRYVGTFAAGLIIMGVYILFRPDGPSGTWVYFNLFWTRQVLLFNSLIQYHALARIVNTLTFLTVSWSLVPSIGSNGLAIALSVGMVIQKIIEYIFVSKTKKKP